MKNYEDVLVNEKHRNTACKNFNTDKRYLLKDADIFYKTLRGRTRNTEKFKTTI